MIDRNNSWYFRARTNSSRQNNRNDYNNNNNSSSVINNSASLVIATTKTWLSSKAWLSSIASIGRIPLRHTVSRSTISCGSRDSIATTIVATVSSGAVREHQCLSKAHHTSPHSSRCGSLGLSGVLVVFLWGRSLIDLLYFLVKMFNILDSKKK